MTSFLKDLESDEPAFRLFTDVFSRFIISGAVSVEPQPPTLATDAKKRRSRSTTTEVDETQMARRVTFAVDEKVKKKFSVSIQFYSCGSDSSYNDLNVLMLSFLSCNTNDIKGGIRK